MLDWMGNLLTALLGGAAVLAGVWVTQRHQRAQAEAARAEARRDAQRRVLAEVLSAAWAKYERFQFMLPILANFHRLPEKDQVEMADTDLVKRLGETSEQLDRALIEASLLIGDDRLRQAVGHLRSANLRFRTKLRDSEDGDRVTDAFGLLGAFGDALLELEQAASDALPVPVADKSWKPT